MSIEVTLFLVCRGLAVSDKYVCDVVELIDSPSEWRQDEHGGLDSPLLGSRHAHQLPWTQWRRSEDTITACAYQIVEGSEHVCGLCRHEVSWGVPDQIADGT